jgi:hypothetical protein
MMADRGSRLRSYAAVAVIVVLTAGIPAFLIALAGWPLPRRLPDWSRIPTALQQGDIPADAMLNTLAVVVWVAWAQLVWAIGWELAVNLPRTHHGDAARPAPLVAVPVGRWAARLVAVVFSFGLSAVSTASPAPALTRPAITATPAHAYETLHPVRAAESVTSRSAPACWQVAPHDNLWDIAEQSLGDGARAAEILELNPALRSPRDLRAGQLLRLPADAKVPAALQQVGEPATAPRPGYLAETVITVQAGDTLWDLSEARLQAADGQPAEPAETLDYLQQVIAANPDTIEDPNLIFVDEQFRFPAIGTPRAAPAPAPTAPSPSPSVEGPAAEPAPATIAVPAPPAPAVSTSAPTAPAAAEQTEHPKTEPPPVGAISRPAPSDASGDSSMPWLAGLAGTTVLASGLVLVHRRARQRAAAAGAANLRPTHRSRRARQVERSLIAASDLPLVRWANHELAALAERLDPRRTTSVPVAVELSQAHGIELLWDAPTPSAPAAWEVADGGWAWRVLYEPDLPVPATPEPAVLPGLVTIGQRDGNIVLVNLEAFGSVAVTGDPVVAENLVRSIIVELAAGEDLANSYVHTVDLELNVAELERAQARDGPTALGLLRTVVADHAALLERHRLDTTFQLRLGGSALGRELTVLAARTDTVDDPDALIESVQSHRGVALILLGESHNVNATIDVAASGQAVLQPLGLTFTASQLASATARQIADAIREASEPDEPSSDHVATTNAGTETAPVEASIRYVGPPRVADPDLNGDDPEIPPRPAQVIVRTLGVPSVDGHPSLGRIELNLVTYLACAGGSATESQVIDAVWNGRAIERGTLWNRISKARAALGGFIPPRDQGTNLVRLAPDVTTDAALLRAALDRARQLSGAQAIDHLRDSLELVTGVPFDAVGYDWAHEQQHYADACELIERAVLTLVELALDLDDVITAKDAVSVGLKALRVNEPLYRARMRIEAHCGNVAGVRNAYDELLSLLAELDDRTGTYNPTNATVNLLEQLLHEDRRTA